MKNIGISFPSLPPFEEYVDEIRPLWESGQITNIGSKVCALEKEVAAFLDVPYATIFVNGHTALEIALEIFELQGEVITTPYTFISTLLAIIRKGLKPIFCDIKDDYTMNEEQVEAAITDKTCAILPVHVYGNLCNNEYLEKISKKYRIPVIYDAAHAFGVRKSGHGVGSYGSISMFSFHATKVFNSVEGGVLTYNDSKLKARLEAIRNFGLREGKPEIIGTNAKISEIHAAMGLCNLRHLDEEIEKRKKLAERYDEILGGEAGIICNRIPYDVESNYSYYPIRIIENEKKEQRDVVFNRLESKGIFARKYYSPLMTDVPYISNGSTEIYMGKYPMAERMEQEVITLPLNTHMCMEDVEQICDAVLKTE